MGGTAESEIKIELSPDSQTDQKSLFEMFKKVIQQSAGGANLNPFFPEVHILSAGENPIDESALDTLTAIVDNGGDIKNDITSALLDSVGTLKSSLSTAASSAISALASIHTGSSPINRVLIPTVMVSNRYGNALLKSYHHLVSKGKQPQLIIRADSQENSMDTVMNEGVDAKGEQEAGRFPKMRIERDIANEGNINGVRLWTKKSWGAVIQRNNQGTFELRIAGKADKEKSMLGSGQGLTERIGAQFSYASPGILSINPVDAYNLLINKVCDGSIYPKGSKVYMKSSITAFNGFDDIS